MIEIDMTHAYNEQLNSSEQKCEYEMQISKISFNLCHVSL
jgi:hypothetical protein